MRGKTGLAFAIAIVLVSCFVVVRVFRQLGQGEYRTEDDSGMTEAEQILTILTPDASVDEFQGFIEKTGKRLGMKIRLEATSQDAESREAQVSNLLTSGNQDVDLIAINDEMASEFIPKGYLEPLGEDVLPEDIRSSFPEEYFQKVCMYDGKVYSAPYGLDIMMFWINQKFLEEAGVSDLNTEDRFDHFLKTDYGENRYAYGSAWEQSYAYNDLFQTVNLFGGDYLDWDNGNSRAAVQYLKNLVENGQTPEDQVLDQYDQMEQKFIDGRYGCIYLYSGAMNIFLNSGAYSDEGIHVSSIPEFYEKKTTIATWQFAINRSSSHKDAAKAFIRYITGDDGAEYYSNCVQRAPARLDILRHGSLDIPDIEVVRSYVNTCELLPRYFTDSPMSGIKSMGTLFQKYIAGDITMDSFCAGAQDIVNGRKSR